MANAGKTPNEVMCPGYTGHGGIYESMSTHTSTKRTKGYEHVRNRRTWQAAQGGAFHPNPAYLATLAQRLYAAERGNQDLPDEQVKIYLQTTSLYLGTLVMLFLAAIA